MSCGLTPRRAKAGRKRSCSTNNASLPNLSALPVMPLDPHAKKLLEMLNAAGAADMSRVAPEQMRADFERLAVMVGERAVAVEAAQDRTVPGPGGAIPIRLYAPKGSGAAILPGLIYFHGGGGVF